MALLARAPQLPPCHPPVLVMDSVQEDEVAALEAKRQVRIHCEKARAAFTNEIQQCQRALGLPVLFPCNLCGQPTGNWCDGCKDPPAQILCTICEGKGDRCRLCFPR